MTPNAPVSSVCIYKNGALVRRRTEVQPGPAEIGGLPLLFAHDSLRVVPDEGAIGSLEEGCRLESGTLGREAAAEKLADAALQSVAASERLRTLQSLIRLLQGLEPPEPEEEKGLPDVQRWTQLRRFADARVEALVEEHEDLSAELVRLRRQQTELRRAARGDVDPARCFRSVRFTLSGTDAPTGVSVEYFVPAARWVPTYTLHVRGDLAELKMQALVAQASGEDWTGASLEFCTADLDRGTTLPELGSWRVGRAQSAPRRAFRPLPDDLDSLFVGYRDHKGRAGLPPAPKLPDPSPRSGGSSGAARPGTDDSDAFDRDLSTGGRAAMYASFEEEGSGEYALSEMLPLDVDSDTTGGFSREDVSSNLSAPPPPGGAARAPPPPPSFTGGAMPPPPPPPSAAPASRPKAGSAPSGDLLMAAMASEPESSKRLRSEAALDAPAAAARFSGPAARVGGAAGPPPPAPLPPEPRPRLRYAYFRLQHPEETGRGELLPVDPIEHLFSLLEDHEVFDLDALRRARAALVRAAERLHRSPLPARCVALSSSSIPHSFEARGTHDLPSDGQFHRVHVSRQEAPADTRFVAVPRTSDEVFRVLRFAHEGDTPHPVGPLQVYIEGTFRAESTLNPKAGQRGLELSLGVEPAVRIASRTLEVRQEEKGLVSQTSQIDHQVHLQVKSGLDKPCRVALYERIPYADDNEKDVEVQLTASVPEASERGLGPDGRKLKGALRLDVVVNPQATADAQFSYQIRLPAKAELVGGNRRE